MSMRSLLVALVLLMGACTEGEYSYKPTGVALNYVETSRNNYEITWSPEWTDWAQANNLSLLGFYLTEPDCDGDQVHKMTFVAYVKISTDNSVIIEVDGSSKTYRCAIDVSRLVLYPKFETRGFDSGDWVLPTSIRIK